MQERSGFCDDVDVITALLRSSMWNVPFSYRLRMLLQELAFSPSLLKLSNTRSPSLYEDTVADGSGPNRRMMV